MFWFCHELYTNWRDLVGTVILLISSIFIINENFSIFIFCVLQYWHVVTLNFLIFILLLYIFY